MFLLNRLNIVLRSRYFKVYVKLADLLNDLQQVKNLLKVKIKKMMIKKMMINKVEIVVEIVMPVKIKKKRRKITPKKSLEK
jgi:hypothetical protein